MAHNFVFLEQVIKIVVTAWPVFSVVSASVGGWKDSDVTFVIFPKIQDRLSRKEKQVL